MQLEQATITLRAREPWEAVDLGAVMLRTWWRPVYGALIAVVLPITVLLHLILLDWPWIALLLTWWLKPLYDRIILHIFAHAVFAAVPSVRATLSSLPALVRHSGLAAALTWRRLDNARAFNLPIQQLEGQHATQARARSQVLGRRAAGHASGFMYTCILFEFVATISLIALVDLVTPATLESEYGIKAFFRSVWDPAASAWSVYVNHAFYVIAICAIEPLYVAGSFALYLNRRTTLEAWDLELSFRRMGGQGRSTQRAAAALIVITCAFAAFLPAHDAYCADQNPQEVIREILSAPEFQEHRSEKAWRKRANNDESDSSISFRWLADLLQFVSDIFAGVIRIAAYILLALGGFFLLRFIARNFDKWPFERSRTLERAAPRVLFGLDVRPEALPENLAEVAAAAADTDPRLALSLLYRGALATLIHRDRIELANGDTEMDCVNRVERTVSVALGAYFRRLVFAWSEAAYARRAPAVAMIQALCREWPQHFAPRTEPT